MEFVLLSKGLILKYLMILAALVSSCSNESNFDTTGTASNREAPPGEEIIIGEEPVAREVVIDEKLDVPKVDEQMVAKQNFDVDGIIQKVPAAAAASAPETTFESQLPSSIEPGGGPAGPSFTYEAPKIFGSVGKSFFNSSFDIQLSGVAGEQLRYLSLESEGAGTLNCANGTAAEEGANITIPIGSFPGDITYFYVISCDSYGNTSPETAYTFTYDNTPPSPPVASEPSKIFTADFSVSLSSSSENPDAPEFIKYTTANVANISCNEATYISPLLITSTTTLKAVVCDQAGNKSEQVSYTYTKIHSPTLSTVTDFSAAEDTDRTITFSQFETNADEADLDGDTLEYELVAISSGTLTTDGSTPVNVGDNLATGAQIGRAHV